MQGQSLLTLSLAPWGGWGSAWIVMRASWLLRSRSPSSLIPTVACIRGHRLMPYAWVVSCLSLTFVWTSRWTYVYLHFQWRTCRLAPNACILWARLSLYQFISQTTACCPISSPLSTWIHHYWSANEIWRGVGQVQGPIHIEVCFLDMVQYSDNEASGIRCNWCHFDWVCATRVWVIHDRT